MGMDEWAKRTDASRNKGEGVDLDNEATDTAIRIRKWHTEWSRHARKTAERQGWEDTSRGVVLGLSR